MPIDAPQLPERFRRYATREFGKEGEAWLEELPSILKRCCDKWGLTLGRPTEEIKVNYIAYVELGHGAEAVLKVGVPHGDFSAEMEALAIYEGHGINRLIDCDKTLNAMLLERLRPGKMLDSVESVREQSEIAARILCDLHATPPPAHHTLPHFMDWMRSAFADARSCEDSERARGYIEQISCVETMMGILTAPDEPQILLHGDLHHWNILSDAHRGWMAIDPKGVIGPRVWTSAGSSTMRWDSERPLGRSGRSCLRRWRFSARCWGKAKSGCLQVPSATRSWVHRGG